MEADKLIKALEELFSDNTHEIEAGENTISFDDYGVEVVYWEDIMSMGHCVDRESMVKTIAWDVLIRRAVAAKGKHKNRHAFTEIQADGDELGST